MATVLRYLSVLLLCVLCASVVQSLAFAASGRIETDLSGPGWTLRLDRAARWIDEELFIQTDMYGRPAGSPLPMNIPVNPPTGGWDALGGLEGKNVAVPGTVEEYFWSAAGNPNGNAGDYRGVSWWSRTFTVDPALRGKRITLRFDSANLRAEVYLNRALVGYDIVGNTPFEADISGAVRFGEENRLDVRVTDPGGTFSWSDENVILWGKYRLPSVHGFGGITGRVAFRATETVYVDDIYVQNKQDPRKAVVAVILKNASGSPVKGAVTLAVREWKNPSSVIWTRTMKTSVPAGGSTISFAVDAPKAKLWGIREPNLYVAAVSFAGEGGIADRDEKRFGFRFFTVGEKNGDKRFYLNGKRVFLFAAMTRGFWPVNGIFPTPDMARRDMEAALSLGYNMMLYHRAIGQPPSIETADEMGVLAYEEPGGYLCNPAPDDGARALRREKLRRMVIRDRSHPSMVIFNMDDLSDKPPTDDDRANLAMVHALDPSRIATYNCINRPRIPPVRDDPEKLHMLPFDPTARTYGWTCPAHLIRWGAWRDDFYRNPRYYLRNVLDPIAGMGDSVDVIGADEIIFYGEEGDIGAPLRLEKIKGELAHTGANGWREREHLDWYASYDRFLDESGMRASFPTVDAFTLALGKNMHYFHGRALENVRISNKADAYVLNGWATEMTRTDFVDAYRNPTGDPSIIRHYTRPLYVAVKLRQTVIPTGYAPVADIHLVNESGLAGQYTLSLTLESPGRTALPLGTFPVTVLGGEEFGQLLIEGVKLPPVVAPGYHILKALLADRSGTVRTDGFDTIFSVDCAKGPGIRGRIAAIDTSGAVAKFLADARGVTVERYDPDCPYYDIIVIGAHDYRTVARLGIPANMRSYDPIMDRVARGATLVILDQAESWAQRLAGADYPAVKYRGIVARGKQARLFVGNNPILGGLPTSRGMDWEYQTFQDGNARGIRFGRAGVEMIAGMASEQTDEVLDALSSVRFGNGHVFITTLNVLGGLSSDAPQSVVAKKLFLNMVEAGNGQ